MKAVMNALVATAVLSGIALADEIDDQIQRLEKENKLLELQRKKQELESSSQMVNQNNTQENNSSTSRSKNGKSVKAYSKNGGFIGVEGVLGGNDMYFWQDSNFVNGSNTTLDLGLVGGYQHYFGSSQRHGIKVSAHIYSGFGNSWNPTASYEDDDGKIETQKMNLSYVPIKFGFDVKYVWDFLERGKHVLGLNAGLGYEFDFYMNGKNVAEDYEPEDLGNNFLNGLYPVIGLHYYYGHHQFELMYRFGGILEEGNTKIISDDPDDMKESIILHTNSYLTINYAYRF